jgi:hypothetical protein
LRKSQRVRSKAQRDRKRFLQSYQELTPQERAKKQKQARLERWKDQAEARRLLPKEAVAKCYHRPIPTRQEILVHEYNQKNGNTRFYSGLQVCASVWTCPVCAAKITERRRQELEKAIKKAYELNLNVYFATYTFSHHQKEPLKDNLNRFKNARHGVKSGRFAKDFKEKYQIVGTIEVLEATYGHYSNGWHPHTHELIFTREPLNLDVFGKELRTKWEHEAARQGLKMNEHGFHITGTKGAIADYIAKFGKEPKDPKHVWGPEAELSKGHLKKGHNPSEEDEHLTPFGILRAIRKGRAELEPVFVEYAAAFKRRHQLQWSPGLKKLLEVNEKTDEELAEEKQEQAPPILAIDKSVWPYVTGNDYKAELLELPNAEEMRRALIDLGADPNYIRIMDISPPASTAEGETEEEEDTPEPATEPTPPTPYHCVHSSQPAAAAPTEQPAPPETAQQEPPAQLTPELFAEQLQPWGVQHKSYMTCQKCNCQLFRPTPWGTWVCCNCEPAPLWSNHTRETIATFYPKRHHRPPPS